MNLVADELGAIIIESSTIDDRFESKRNEPSNIGSFGYAATAWIEDGPATLILGIATIVIGILMIRRTNNGKTCQKHSQPEAANTGQVVHFTPKKQTPLFSISLFGMGAGMALNPCVPLATVLTVSATLATPTDGLMLGLAFGIGAVVAIPTLIFGIVVAHFGAQIRENLTQWSSKLELAAGGMLVLLGSLTATGMIQV